MMSIAGTVKKKTGIQNYFGNLAYKSIVEINVFNFLKKHYEKIIFRKHCMM